MYATLNAKQQSKIEVRAMAAVSLLAISMANLRAPDRLASIFFSADWNLSYSYNERPAVYELEQINWHTA